MLRFSVICADGRLKIFKFQPQGVDATARKKPHLETPLIGWEAQDAQGD
jgi:hypothetical protein